MAEYPTDEELEMKAEELLKHRFSDELYDKFVELIAKKGAMIAPFWEHPEVKRILEEIKGSRMEAKEVMNHEKLVAITDGLCVKFKTSWVGLINGGLVPSDLEQYIIELYDVVAEVTWSLAYKAGIREVVEWIKQEGHISYTRAPLKLKEVSINHTIWQTRLKELGTEE